ncbi:MAG: hypothetical protein HRT70_09265 [Flavobacteriaceae bacterium]|nr:hypothetical protein [Flavobacteriaceae bacterium]
MPALSLPKPWLELVEAYGGKKKFAKLIEVNESTIYRWAHRQTDISKLARIELKRLAKEKGIEFNWN